MPFVPQEVFADRAKRIRTFLAQEGCGALIITTPENFYMVSGFHLDVAPWERPVAAVIPAEGEPFLIMNELSTNHLRFAIERGTLFIRDYTIYDEHPRLRNRTWTVLQWGKLLRTKLRERGISGGTLAVEGAGPARLKAVAPEFSFRDVTPFLRRMREVKYPAELEIMRLCAALTDFGQDRYVEHLKPGLTVAAYDFEISRQIAEEGARRYPEDRLEIRIRSSCGPASAAPHGSGANCAEQFEVGEGVVNIIICRLNGLVVENERTLFVGEPKDERQRSAFEVATAANEAAAERMVPGNPVSSADAAAQWVIEQAGFGDSINHRTGHGMGIAGHEFPEDMPFNHRPFEENEVFSCEPGIYIPGLGGFRHDDTVIITAGGPEVITKRSKKLEDQIVPI
jgi:Xaa-Pro aminopeptidase